MNRASRKEVQRHKRISLSQKELKHQRLQQRHQKLQAKFKAYKQTHERKVSLLRCQLKHTLKFVGDKVQSLETRLLWYQKQWKHQQRQFSASPEPAVVSKPQKNKCIQTETEPERRNQSPAKAERRKSTPIVVIPAPSMTGSMALELRPSPSRKTQHECVVRRQWDEARTSSSIGSPARTVSFAANETLQDISGDAMAKHNALVSRLRSRLDTMTDILFTTRDKLHEEFDQMSMPQSVDLGDEEVELEVAQMEIRKTLTSPLRSPSLTSPLSALTDQPKTALESCMSGSSSTSSSTFVSSPAKALSAGDEDSLDDFQSVISRVTQNMTRLGNNLKIMSSVSSPNSDTENDEDSL